ncbi:MAG: LytTR family DNA-binding domain-containing protein [Flammeovirgaceae bacterium]|nr:LytTR family DNA-binding domain-containing protein [Flammeovirgaceae bacterium]
MVLDKLNILIIDDEEDTHELIQFYIHKLSPNTKVSSCYSFAEVQKKKDADTYNLVFLDMEINADKGFDLLDKINPKAKVIVISAHVNYSLEAFDKNVVDYLKKPFTEERFKQALLKCEDTNPQETPTTLPEKLTLKGNRKTYDVLVNDIQFIKSLGNYVSIKIKNVKTPIIAYAALKEFDSFVTGKKFIQVHKSFIINPQYILRVEKSKIYLQENNVVPIGVKYTLFVTKILNRLLPPQV